MNTTILANLCNLIFFFLIFVFLSCAKRDIIIKDIKEIPQNNNYFIKNLNKNKPLISIKHEKFLENFYNFKFLEPFSSVYPKYDKYFVSWGLRKIKNRKYYLTNGKIDKNFIKKISENCNFKTYPNFIKRAITIKNSYLRTLPLDIPIFTHKNNFPFDIVQNSSIYIGTPLLITHLSKDKRWAFVENYIAAGWIKVTDIAFVNEKFIYKWFSKKFISPIYDRVPVYDNYGNFLFLAFIGAQFPLSKEYKNFYTVKIPVRLENGYAGIKKVKLSKKYFIKKPLKLNYKNLAFIANQLLSQPYSWGGLYFYRDCSMTLRDLFSIFDIYLPRNSYDQAHFEELGSYIDISKMPPRKKEKFILKNGIPYLTLIWFPGHIMLYIGKYKNKAIIFHNFWSIKLKNHKNYIVGKSAITTLFPGEELNNVLKKYNYRYKIKGIKFIIQK